MEDAKRTNNINKYVTLWSHTQIRNMGHDEIQPTNDQSLTFRGQTPNKYHTRPTQRQLKHVFDMTRRLQAIQCKKHDVKRKQWHKVIQMVYLQLSSSYWGWGKKLSS